MTARYVTRSSPETVKVTFSNSELLTATSQHPIWSLDRESWVPLGALQEGESVQSREGAIQVTSVREGGPATVYNIEVNTEHVYEVTASGILVHNGGLTSAECDRLTKLLEMQKNKPLTKIQQARVDELMGKALEHEQYTRKLVGQLGTSVGHQRSLLREAMETAYSKYAAHHLIPMEALK